MSKYGKLRAAFKSDKYYTNNKMQPNNSLAQMMASLL